ncbi:MAG: CRISPR-associated protein Cse2 family, partial [Akkermansiaceae bacterium]|nr:CRISPR-associated protein Cse2 family [Akkermansiaceae bacterium]
LKDQPIDFANLLTGLPYWNGERKRTQISWARDFYRSVDTGTPTEPETQEESAQ